MTQNLGQKSKSGPISFRYCPLIYETVVICQPPLQMGEEIASENGRISTLKASWPWPWIGSYCIPSCVTCRPLPTHQISLKSKKLFVDGWTNVRTGRQTF